MNDVAPPGTNLPTLQPSTATGFTHELRFSVGVGTHRHLALVPFHGFNLVGTPEVVLEEDGVVAHLVLERNSETSISPEAPDPHGTFALASQEPETTVAPDHSGMAIGWGGQFQDGLDWDFWQMIALPVLDGTDTIGLHFPVARDSGQRTYPLTLVPGEEHVLHGHEGFGDWVKPEDARYFTMGAGGATVELHRSGVWPWENFPDSIPATPYGADHRQRDIGRNSNVWGPIWAWGQVDTDDSIPPGFPIPDGTIETIELLEVEEGGPSCGDCPWDDGGQCTCHPFHMDSGEWEMLALNFLHLHTEGGKEYWAMATCD